MAISVNPYTLKKIKDHRDNTPEEIANKLLRADKAFSSWGKLSIAERKTHIMKFAADLDANAEAYARVMTDEMGKTLADGISEVKKCAVTCEYFADNAETFLKEIETRSEFKRSFVTYNPLGVVLAIMPWNFPFWQVLRAAIPALLAGNTVVLKHASNVSECAILLEDIFKKIGAPANIFQTIIVSGKNVDAVISNKLVKAVTFTGSTDVGRTIAETAGKHLKKCVLELGGNDPYIVLEDADIELAATKCAASRLINAGQSCIAAKRFIASENIYDSFLETFTAKMKEARFGDPLDKNSKIGPLVSLEARDKIHDIVQKYVRSGACRLVLGGVIPEVNGAFYLPTVLEVLDESKILDIEIFGPVAIVHKAKDDEDALRIANNSNFGLGAAVFSKNIKKAEELAAKHVESGCVFVNDFVKSDPRFPFGGVKESGYGRELSEFGIREFTNIKTVVVA